MLSFGVHNIPQGLYPWYIHFQSLLSSGDRHNGPSVHRHKLYISQPAVSLFIRRVLLWTQRSWIQALSLAQMTDNENENDRLIKILGK